MINRWCHICICSIANYCSSNIQTIYIYAQLALHNHSDISYMFMMTHKLSKCNWLYVCIYIYICVFLFGITRLLCFTNIGLYIYICVCIIFDSYCIYSFFFTSIMYLLPGVHIHGLEAARKTARCWAMASRRRAGFQCLWCWNGILVVNSGQSWFNNGLIVVGNCLNLKWLVVTTNG